MSVGTFPVLGELHTGVKCSIAKTAAEPDPWSYRQQPAASALLRAQLASEHHPPLCIFILKCVFSLHSCLKDVVKCHSNQSHFW